MQPAIYAVKELLNYEYRKGRMFLYLDLHAHAGKKGCFIYGNHNDDPEIKAASLLYP